MKLINEKYRTLKPSIQYLADEVVIAQAWKKTHGYIRSFNWYADTLALDISALTIEDNAKVWAEAINQGKDLNPLELVPAAKSEAWSLSKDGWKPKEERKKTPLRPLAHITIRDQTWASAVMLCLADAVETAQGDCSLKNNITFAKTRANKVYSYGNRLVCDWKIDGKGWFRWGNSETYRKFFTDYQNFLKRPLELGRDVVNQSAGNEEIYIVNLDLAKFYNTVNIPILIERLKAISNGFGHEEDTSFWQSVERIFKWQWSDKDIEQAEKLELGSITSGLPQGLVSAGFLANAYLNNFDKIIGDSIGRTLSSSKGIVLHDYCRYVDDLRLVVSADNQSIGEISTVVNTFIKKLLKEHGGEELSINSGKTKVNLLSDLDNSGSMSNRIEQLQGELSGPADRDTLDSVTGVLESFLTIEDESLSFLNVQSPDSALLSIANFDHDIRSDTLKRFAANRLESIVRSKRRMTDNSEGSKSFNTDNESENELLAKKLIMAWMKDPSLGLVLRKAIEVYPDADLFEPVFDAILSRSSFSGKSVEDANKVTAAIMDYLLADLFRCASDFNGYFQVIDYPKNLKPSSLIELLTRVAQKVIPLASESKFVLRQALMLLAVANKPVLINSATSTIQHSLHQILVNNPPEYQPQRSALFEVAGQITGNFDTYASLFIENTSELNAKQYDALEVFAKRGGPFWLALWKQLKKQKLTSLIEQLKWASPLSSSSPTPQKQILSKVISSDLNGFEFEHGAIKLALGLLTLVRENPVGVCCSPNQLRVSYLNKDAWNKIWKHYIEDIKCEFIPGIVSDPRFKKPDWIEGSGTDDSVVLYWIGTILRSSVLGGADFTGNKWKESNVITYKGLRTSWYKRRMGMIHAPEALIGEYATVTNWFSDLLMRCLQWPGFESSFVKCDDVRDITDIDSFEVCLKQRLLLLNGLTCFSSELPALPTEVHRPIRDKKFRIVTVQQLLPKSTDFNPSDIELNNPAIRARHREHLAAVCNLTVKTLEAKLIVDGEEKKPSADLIVFPEVSVHIDDQDLIKRLADKTNSIVFAGLVFTNHEGKLVNIARWFIPDYRESGRQWVIRDQGKQHMTKHEKEFGISSYRPCQHILEIHGHPEGPFKVTGAICYDATDIKLAADLRDKTDLFVISAHNQDVSTFDNMASALQWHMYQHVVIANIGEFGGSTIQAPYKEQYDKLISHVHGVGQIAINTADIDLAAFRRKQKSYRKVKAKPAGVN
tara:strand:+ start:11872 stop:15558 length:3687 start_codon:yes stop_codon:yes gene_type:complete